MEREEREEREVIDIMYVSKGSSFVEKTIGNFHKNGGLERYRNFRYNFYLLEKNGDRIKSEITGRFYEVGDFIVQRLGSDVLTYRIKKFLISEYVLLELELEPVKEKKQN